MHRGNIREKVLKEIFTFPLCSYYFVKHSVSVTLSNQFNSQLDDAEPHPTHECYNTKEKDPFMYFFFHVEPRVKNELQRGTNVPNS